jgi:quinol monooxygenase YgiN
VIRKMAEYTVRDGELETVELAIREFVQAVCQYEPKTVYHAYRRQGEPRFVHFMAFPDAAAETRHAHAAYTQHFVELLYPRCEARPVFTDLEIIG